MAHNYANYSNANKVLAKRPTPQHRPIPGREQEMVKNDAGGYSFKNDHWSTLRRFLIIGTEANTYYVSSKTLSEKNVSNLKKCLKENGKRFVDLVAYVSNEGLAPKNDPAIFALAVACTPQFSDPRTIRYAFSQLDKVCRTASHIFTFVSYIDQMRGWGATLRKGLRVWYLRTPIDRLVYQTMKYRTRQGWSHRDLLKKLHPSTKNPIRNELFSHIVNGTEVKSPKLEMVNIVNRISTFSEKEVIKAIHTYGLTREMIPTEHLNSPRVWEALLPKMPMTALLRNLNKMTAVGLISPGSDAMRLAVDKLRNENNIKAARLHPINVLVGWYAYKGGRSIMANTTIRRGYRSEQRRNDGLSWTPVPRINEALEEAFYASFKYVEPTGKNISINLDVSGSMSAGCLPTMPMLNARIVSAVLAMAVARSERNCEFFGFTGELITLNITARDSLDSVIKKISGLPYGSTDCAQPMIEALKKHRKYDAFVIYTDNDTWVGRIQPSQALEQYRQRMVKGAKLVVCSMIPSNFSIADPKDPGSMDIVGFDSSTPQLISNFIADRF